MNIGKAIRTCRIQKNLKQSELAEKANISVSYLSLLEQGKRDPSFSTVEEIASALNIPVSILVFLAAEKSEVAELSPEIAEKLSFTALQLIGEGSSGRSRIR